MLPELIMTPTDFVAVLNQTLDFAYPTAVIEGEISEFRISKNKWVYFSLKDELSSVAFFGSVYQLPGPLTDGMMVKVTGSPRLHPRYGFSVSFSSITPVGEGSIKKAADLVRLKLAGEGLFAPERKRLLPVTPQRVGLITAATSAAAADFMKGLNNRWVGVEVLLIDSLVQGDNAPEQIIKAVSHFNQMTNPPEVLVITRGGGGVEDLSVFNDERVIRAVAASRTPTLIAIGHETDESLAELAADSRANTPTAAANILVPDKKQILSELDFIKKAIAQSVKQILHDAQADRLHKLAVVKNSLTAIMVLERDRLRALSRILTAFNPNNVLRRGYALVSVGDRLLTSTNKVKLGDMLNIKMYDGNIKAKAKSIDA